MTGGPNDDYLGWDRISKGSLRSARRLSSRRGRDESGLFLVEGAQAVREALAWPGKVNLLETSDPARDAEHVEVATCRGVRVVVLTDEDVNALSDTVTSQGIFAVCRQVTRRELPDEAVRLAVICAQVRDPGNAGTVIRCADAFGADCVILTRGSVDPHNPKTVRSSVGSIFHLPVVVGVELADAVEWAHQHQMSVLAADGGGHSLDVVARSGCLKRPIAWLMGNEAWGLPEADRALADEIVGVPMWGAAESLNLSTAAAVVLYATASEQRA